MNNKQYIGKEILGAWKLVKWIYENEDGEEVRFFGKAPEGLLIYHESGFMSVQIAQEERPAFASDSLDGGTKEEQAAAFATFLSYYGKYVEEEPTKFVHTVEGTLFPNWLGNKEIRYANISGDLLILSTPPVKVSGGSIVFKITWEKINNDINELLKSNHLTQNQ